MNLALSSPDEFFSSIGLWSWSTIHPQRVYSLGADIYVNHPQSPPSHLQDYSTCNSARWLNLFPWFDPNEWCMKNGLLSGGLNSGPLGHESSALPLDHGYSPGLIVLHLFVWFLWVKKILLFACIISNLKSAMCNLRICNK